MSLLFTEFNLDDALAVRYENGWEDGITEAKLEMARNLLARGSSPEFVHEITGLDVDTIEKIK